VKETHLSFSQDFDQAMALKKKEREKGKPT